MTCPACQPLAATGRAQLDGRLRDVREFQSGFARCPQCGGTDWGTTEEFILPSSPLVRVRQAPISIAVKLSDAGARLCCICQQSQPTDSTLIDGSVFHRNCYADLKQTFDRLAHTESTLLAETRKSPTFGQSIAMLFSEARRLGVAQSKELLVSRIEDVRRTIRETKDILRQIHDVWPDYPPDWEERRELVRARDKYACMECGGNNRLQLHHRRAIREGGTHRIDNLILLCELCHSDAHGGRQFRYQQERGDEGSPTAIQQKIALINRALAQKIDVRFRYRKPDGTITKRTVTPQELRKLTIFELRKLIGHKAKIEKEGRLCLFGRCHLRQAKRTFAIDRIHKLRIVGDD
jgi:hypothetical protein